jgi:hypothetical protein
MYGDAHLKNIYWPRFIPTWLLARWRATWMDRLPEVPFDPNKLGAIDWAIDRLQLLCIIVLLKICMDAESATTPRPGLHWLVLWVVSGHLTSHRNSSIH